MRRSRRGMPPRLPDVPAPSAAKRRPPAPPTDQGRLVEAHVAGANPRLGRAEVTHAVERLGTGAPEASFGLGLGAVDRDEAWDALERRWGCAHDDDRAHIDPDLTLSGFDDAVGRVHAVAVAGGRIALATSRPAALLPLLTALSAFAATAGATVLGTDRFGDFGPGRRALWWHDGVAVVTDGAALLADDTAEAGSEWLFAVGRPDLVVADRGFAGAAVAAGHDTVVLAGLDAPALGVAAGRGLPARIVPLHPTCPPAAYGSLTGRIRVPATGPTRTNGLTGPNGRAEDRGR